MPKVALVVALALKPPPPATTRLPVGVTMLPPVTLPVADTVAP